MALASLIAVSRVYLGAHFPSDVLAGALTGACLGGVAGHQFVSRRTGVRRPPAELPRSAAGRQSGTRAKKTLNVRPPCGTFLSMPARSQAPSRSPSPSRHLPAVATRTRAAPTTRQRPASATAEVKDVTLAGVDTSAMTPRERHEWSSLVDVAVRAVPGRAGLRRPVRAGEARLRRVHAAAKWVARAVRDGASEEPDPARVQGAVRPVGVKTLPLDGSPTKGPDDAPVTICRVRRLRVPALRAGRAACIDAVARGASRARCGSSTRATRCRSTSTASPLRARRSPPARRESSGRWSTCSSSASSTSRTPTSSATQRCSGSTSPSGRPTWTPRRSRPRQRRPQARGRAQAQGHAHHLRQRPRARRRGGRVARRARRRRARGPAGPAARRRLRRAAGNGRPVGRRRAHGAR